MAAPLWQAGQLYLPGDIVQPITAPATTPVAITNPGFETGDDTGWDLGTATAVSSADKFTGTYSIEFTGSGGLTDTLQAAASAVQPGQSITARMMYQQGAASAGHNGGRVLLAFYTAGMVLIGTPSLGNVVDSGSGGAWGQSVVTATAPDTAAFVKLGVRVNRTNGNPSWADDFTWNHVTQPPAGLVFKAVQPAAGMSGSSEPAWPNTVGLTVVDNEVTWEAIAATRVEWTASPILVSGATEPTWPTQIGEFVADGSIKWEAFSRRVEDENCPNSKIVAIVGSKVFAADRDIARFCATANPLDWTTERDAGYLPLGLQQANANDFNTGVFNQYRSNFVAFNASSFQNWQADPDPAAMALLDQMDGVGSTWQQAAQPVANDLFYLAALGVRTVGIAGGSTNLQAGDVGMPIDPLVKDAVRVALANGSAVRSTYYPSSGQYWLAFAEYPPPLPSISGNVPGGQVGEAISGAYTVSGGVLPYDAITVLSGTFPPGLTLNPNGSYSGTLTTPGDYSWVVGGADAYATPFSLPDSAHVAFVTISGDAPSGLKGMAYTPYQYTIDGSDPPFTVSVVAGAIPQGLSLTSGGLLQGGPPTAVEVASYTLRVTDALGNTADLPDSVEIGAMAWDPANTGTGAVLQDSNRRVVSTVTASERPMTRSVVSFTSQKVYCELVVTTMHAATGDPALSIGVVDGAHPTSGVSYVGRYSGQGLLPPHNTAVNVTIWDQTQPYMYGGAEPVESHVMCLAIDGAAGLIWMGKDGVWSQYQFSAPVASAPETGTLPATFPFPLPAGPYYVAACVRKADDGTQNALTLRVNESEFDYPIPPGFVALGSLG